VIEWLHENGGDLAAGSLVLMFVLACLLGLAALGKEVYCFVLAACGG
jgi:hypothetical protein